MKTRLDAELVRRELARSREAAADLIESRSVLVNGIPATKPATQVDAETSITLQGNRDDFVSRGGHKLSGALDAFPEIIVEGARALDAGASTGGFTDVLLRRGAKEVVARCWLWSVSVGTPTGSSSACFGPNKYTSPHR
jgi:23S rRNA (cytidine1920-2'-O)/16S rRNA (cytidine1409-2'-O)-methyltransferase